MQEITTLTSSLQRALQRLSEALASQNKDIVIDAAIQRFEFSYELFWKWLKKLLFMREGIEAQSPKQVLQNAYMLGWISDEDLWLKMLQDRNLTSHTYQEKLAIEIFQHLPLYLEKMQSAYQNLQEKLLIKK